MFVRMKQTVLDAEQLEDELEVMRRQLSEKDEALSHLKTYAQKLEEEKVSLVEQIEIITDEMSSIEQARAIDNINMANLTRSQRSLQLHLEEARVSMAQKDEVLMKKDFAYEQLEGSLSEYTSVIQVEGRAMLLRLEALGRTPTRSNPLSKNTR
ncbi:hypothetical protein DPEC_G00089640 [Dallia pectoralis]|uniref:Uncharacterized protein n=1 Tax=Dallia pectoralis TaxID=75939 RepID=A0ACC2H0T1_DALPE|nr:hypothetical protein DPEC_G00089640 [Dallia pectoralis]